MTSSVFLFSAVLIALLSSYCCICLVLDVASKGAGSAQYSHLAYVNVDGVRVDQDYSGWKMVILDSVTGQVRHSERFNLWTGGLTAVNNALEFLSDSQQIYLKANNTIFACVIYETGTVPSSSSANATLILNEFKAWSGDASLVLGFRSAFIFVGLSDTSKVGSVTWPEWHYLYTASTLDQSVQLTHSVDLNLISSEAEYGVDITIRIEDILQQNQTEQLRSALNDYVIHKTANTTNCSEVVDTSSHSEDEETVIQSSIITCTESTEHQLLLAISTTELEYDVINAIITEAEVKEIEIQTVREGKTDTDSVDVDTEDTNKNYWWFIVLVILLLIVLCAVIIHLIRKKEMLQPGAVANQEQNGGDGGELAERDRHEKKEKVCDSEDMLERTMEPAGTVTKTAATAGGFEDENIADGEFVINGDDDEGEHEGIETIRSDNDLYTHQTQQ